jgi:hypothetical protein
MRPIPARKCENLPKFRLCLSRPLLTLGFVVVVCLPSSAQVTDAASRWANVSGWKGTVTVSGRGSGSTRSRCTKEYTNTQTITSSPLLQVSVRCRPY